MLKTLALVAVCVATLVSAVACGWRGGDSDEEPTIPPAATDVPGAPTSIAPGGVPPLVYGALIAGDEIQLAGLTFYQQVSCAVSPSDASEPECRENEDEGEEVDVFPLVICERTWVRPELVPDAYAGALGESTPSMFAAYVPAADAFDEPDITSALVIRTGTADDGTPAGFLVAVNSGGRVVTLEASCNDFAALYAEDRVGSFIAPPPQGE